MKQVIKKDVTGKRMSIHPDMGKLNAADFKKWFDTFYYDTGDTKESKRCDKEYVIVCKWHKKREAEKAAK